MSAFTSKLKQLFRTGYNNKEIPKDETETELSESKTIIEEKQRCINEILSAKFYMEDVVDKIVARFKALHEYQHDLLFRTDNLVFLYVKDRRRREFILTHPERNIKDILKASDGHELFKWREECGKGMPIDYNFMISKGALSNFQGSKGCVGELSVVDSVSEDYDFIRFKAEPIPSSRRYDDGKDEVYLHARWFRLAQLKYKFLMDLTLATIVTLNINIAFEVGIVDLDYVNIYIQNIWTYLCKINENPSGPIRLSYQEWTKEWHEELTVSQYKTAVKQLECSNLKSELDSLSKSIFDDMKRRIRDAVMLEVAFVDALVPFDMMYIKYLQIVKKGRAPKERFWTFGSIVCRLSRTMNRTA